MFSGNGWGAWLPGRDGRRRPLHRPQRHHQTQQTQKNVGIHCC